MPTLGALLIYANSKETQSLAKNSCRQKCLDKSLATLFPFTPNSPKNENSKTMTKRPGDIILHKCTPNHMLHCSWDMAVVGCNCYFSFWAIFSPFTLLTAQKMKKKTPGGINANHKCTKNHDHMLYCSWDMVCEGCNCYHSFWDNFCLFTPPSLSLTARKMKISKQWKKHLDISSFYRSVPKIMIICYTVPEI